MDFAGTAIVFRRKSYQDLLQVERGVRASRGTIPSLGGKQDRKSALECYVAFFCDRDGSAPRYSAKPTQFEAARSKRGSQAAGKMRPSFTPVQTLPRKLTMLGPGLFNVYTNAV